MNELIQIRKYLQEQSVGGLISNDYIEDIDVSGNTVTVTSRVQGQIVIKTFTQGLPQLTYNETTDRVVSSKPIETTLNSFYLRDQHRVSSGAENVFFTNQGSNIDFFPCWQGLKDQSLIENQDITGILKPTGRYYSDNMFGLAQLGNPLIDTPIAFDDTTTYTLSLSVYGFEFVTCENIDPSMYLDYIVTLGGREIYTQQFKNYTLSKGDVVKFWFTHPLEGHAGQTARAVITKKNVADETDLGVLQVETAENLNPSGLVKPYVKIFIRTFEDKEIAFKEDITVKYSGVWDASGNIPDLTTLTPTNGAFFFVTTAGTYDGVDYNVNDQIIYNTTTATWDRIPDTSLKLTEIENSSLGEYDIYVDASYTGDDQVGSNLKPYTSLETAVSNSSEGNRILIKGSVEVSAKITLPHTLYFYGTKGSEIKYSVFASINDDIFFYDTFGSVSFGFYNLIFKNSGAYAINLKICDKVDIEDCEFKNCGWDGSQLNTAAPSSVTGLLGYDSNPTLLQTFSQSSSVSSGGAIKLNLVGQLRIIGNNISNNKSAIFLEDCGYLGAGFITRNVISSNLSYGIYLGNDDGVSQGCHNITVTINAIAFNASAAILSITGLNNKFSQNEINSNWNAGFIGYSCGNLTIRDSGMYNNNRSEVDYTGNPSPTSSIILSDYLLTTNGYSSCHPDAKFICEILDMQVHNTIDTSFEVTGIKLEANLGVYAATADAKNIIRIDDAGFIGQSYAIDMSQCDVSNLHLSLGDNSYQSIKESSVKPPLNGRYNELPFSNHVMSVKELNIVTDPLKNSVSLIDNLNGTIINVYAVNELKSIQNTNSIDIIQKGSNKIQLKGLLLGNVFVNGQQAGSNLATMNDTINSAFDLSLIQYKEYIETLLELDNYIHFFYVESPDGVFHYPLFLSSEDAADFDKNETGNALGTFNTQTFVDDTTNTTFYSPTTSYVDNGTSAPEHGTYSNTNSIVWNIISTDIDSNYVPTFTDLTFNVNENENVNLQYKAAGDMNSYNLTNIPTGLVDNGSALIGTTETILDNNDVQHIINVTKANAFGSVQGTITINIIASIVSFVPENATITGNTITYTYDATNTNPLNFGQFFKNGNPINGFDGTVVTSISSPPLNITNIGLLHIGTQDISTTGTFSIVVHGETFTVIMLAATSPLTTGWMDTSTQIDPNGDRFYLPNDLLLKLLNSMTNHTSVFIGVKADDWNDTKNGAALSNSGFFDNYAIEFKRQSATVGILYLGLSRNVAVFGSYYYFDTTNPSFKISGFIEIKSNKVQMGIDNADNTYYETMYNYPGTKGPSNNTISSGVKDIGVYFDASLIGGSIDFASVDFDNSQPLKTPFNHGFESTSSSEQIVMFGNVYPVAPIFDSTSHVHPKNSLNYTSISGSAWSLSCVFKVTSGDSIIYKLEGGLSNFYGISIELQEASSSTVNLYIKWGADFNSTYNLYEVTYTHAFAKGSYQCLNIQYLGHNTVNENGNVSFTDSDYEYALQVSTITLANSTRYQTKLTGGTHTSTTPGVIGGYFDSSTTYSETIAHTNSINGNAIFASFSLTSLRQNQPIMSHVEIATYLFHPFDWLKLYREGKLYRSLGVEKTFSYGDVDSIANNIIYLFGDHPMYSYPYCVNASRGVDSNYNSSNGQFSNAQITNSTANSIININIPNLS